MGKARKILLYVCLAIFIFIIGMMIRRVYDNQFENKPLVNTATAAAQSPMKREVKPATEAPAMLLKKPDAPASGGLRPPEKKDN